ncbi:sugar phosphate isomerase/epimerase [Halobellus sp. Atlit-31R]|nr:sugar phosphate isomerase/epimerase [Halobellus sp. Atlit-31R]
MYYGASLDLRMADSPADFAQYIDSLGLSHVELRHNYLDSRDQPPSVAELVDVRESYGLTYTVHAPYSDCNPGHLNETLRRATGESLKRALDTAAAVGAGAVVTHGGAVRRSYPEHVKRRSREQAVRTIREAAAHAADVGVPLCVENSRQKRTTQYTTETPDRLAAFLDDVAVGVDTESLGVTVDVGHAKATGVEPTAFVEAVEHPVVVAHLHDNDGDADDHDPLPTYRSVAAELGATYNVLEMKSKADIAECVAGETAG